MRTGSMTFFLTVLALMLSPLVAEAQPCMGTPIAAGQNAGTASIGFPNGANIFGAAVHHNTANGPLSVVGRFEHTTFDAQGINSMNAVGGTLAYDLTGEIAQFPETLSFCAVGGLMYGRWSFGESVTFNVIEIPLGVGFGGTVVLGDDEAQALKLIPYAVPAIYHTRISAEGETASETDLDMVLGGTILFTRFFAGLALENLFRAGSSYVTLRAGMIF